MPDSYVDLYFYGKETPNLGKVRFRDHANGVCYLSVRGKTGAAYNTDRTFQWTSAVQALAILFLRLSIFQKSKNATLRRPLQPALEGLKGSIVVSLDYALDKQPAWLLDMFGVTASGKPRIRQFLTRSNPGLRRPGPVKISIRNNRHKDLNISVFWEEEEVLKEDELVDLSRLIEKKCGTLVLEELAAEIQPSADKVYSNGREEVLNHKPALRAATFKTPFVREGSKYGDVFVRVYQHEGNLALISLFCSFEEFKVNRKVPVRIHSSCLPSDILTVNDCDCRSQLDYSLELLKKEKGVLIHLFQEGRGIGLFSKYIGMSISSQYMLDTYESFERMQVPRDGRGYELAGMVLKDLGAASIRLLTNNPIKVESVQREGINVVQEECFGRLSPQNLSYLYTKMTKGNHQLQRLFEPDAVDEFFIVESHTKPQKKLKIWIFGGDDTLWEDNIIYEDIIRQFMDYIGAWVPTISRSDLRNQLDSIESIVIKEMGFGPIGFKESLRRCFTEVCSQNNVSLPLPAELLESVIPRLSAVGAKIPSITFETLSKLRNRGDGLILFSQGPVNIQLKKIAQSRLGYLFDVIAITSQKSKETYSKLMNTISIYSDDVSVVGSSIDTDINPAITLNYAAYHLKNPNSWYMINREDVNTSKYKEIFSLKQLA